MSIYGKLSTLFNQIPKEKEILYHFTSKETALEKILESGKLRLNKFGMTNDPRESKYWLFNYKFSYDDFGKTFKDRNDFLNDQLKNHINVICFSIDDPNSDLDHNNRNGYMHSRTWAQYASNHNGICLLFDKNKLVNSVIEKYSSLYIVWNDSVKYNNRTELDKPDYLTIQTNTITKQSLSEHIIKSKNELFFEKRKEWADENEYRIIIYTPELIEDHLYFDISDSIIGIIVGVDFHNVYESCIKNYCLKYKISADRIQWREGNPILCAPISL